jgi:hypothetical protein
MLDLFTLLGALNPPNCEKRGVLVTTPFCWLLSVGLRGAAAPLGLKSSIWFPYIGGVGGIPPCGDIPGIGA